MLSIVIFGIVSTISQIIAIGAQSIFLIQSGASHQKRNLIAPIICSICDTILILSGVLLCSNIAKIDPLFIKIIKTTGAGFLFYYSYLSFTRDNKVAGKNNISNRGIFSLAILVSILNPNAWVDAFIVLGSLSLEFNSIFDKYVFTIASCLTCFIWNIFLYSMSSRFLKNLDSKNMNYINYGVGFIMIFLGLKLLI